MPPLEEEQATNLSTLKEQLKKQLAAVEEHEKALEASLQPQTTSQVDQLMQKLQDAMEELKKQRAVLAKKEEEEKKNQKK